MNDQYQTQDIMRQITTPANQSGTTQEQSLFITNKVIENVLQLATINNATVSNNKIEDTRERLITLEMHVKQIQSDIQEIKNTIHDNNKNNKEDKKFNITTILTIISIVIACIAAYFSYQATQPKQVPLQSSEVFGKLK